MSNFNRVYITSDGEPATGLSPTFETLKNVDDGTNFTPQPTIEEIGGGWYRFNISLNPFEHLIGVVDAGSSILDPSERKIPIDSRFSDFEIDNKQVYINTVFDEDTDTLTFLVFLLINGTILQSELTSVSIAIKDENHTDLFTVSTSSFTNGVAVVSKSGPGLTENRGFYAIATLVTTNETIVSADSYFTIK